MNKELTNEQALWVERMQLKDRIKTGRLDEILAKSRKALLTAELPRVKPNKLTSLKLHES